MMLILILIFICSFIRIDAFGENSFFNEPTEQERAHQALSASFNALLQERQKALDEGRADEFTPAEHRLLNWYDEARYDNPGQMADVFDRISGAYNRLNRKFAKRYVTMPSLDKLHTKAKIDASEFRKNYLNENMMPGTPLDRDIWNHFFPEIFAAGSSQRNVQGTPLGAQQIVSPRQSPSPFAAVPYVASRSRRLFQDDLEPLVLQSPRTPNTPDPLTPSDRRRSRAEAGLDNEEGAPATRRPRPQARRGLIFDSPAPAIHPPYNPNPDDENGPNGGGIPVQ